MKKEIIFWVLWVALLVVGISATNQIGESINDNKNNLQGVRKTYKSLRIRLSQRLITLIASMSLYKD